MSRPVTPIDLWRTGLELWHLGSETHMVVTMRMLGMMGVWSVSPRENERMVSEKLPAFTKAAVAASQSAFRGDRPDEILNAAIHPLRGRTHANSRRLSRRGLRKEGK